jgi:hypothetical protein
VSGRAGMIWLVDDALVVLRQEFEEGEGSLLHWLRPELVWDRGTPTFHGRSRSSTTTSAYSAWTLRTAVAALDATAEMTPKPTASRLVWRLPGDVSMAY